MSRYRFLKIFLWKEMRALRYNLALQLVLVLFSLLGYLVSASSIIGQAEKITVYLSGGQHSPFIQYLTLVESRLTLTRQKVPLPANLQKNEVLLELARGFLHPNFPNAAEDLHLYFPVGEEATARQVVQTLEGHLLTLLQIKPPIRVHAADTQNHSLLPTSTPQIPTDILRRDPPTKQMTMSLLCALALIVVSLNMFTITFGEEKSSKALLAQLLSPATAFDVVISKFIFFLALSLILSGILAGVYSPSSAKSPSLWLLLSLASMSYMSIGLLITALTKRQSSASLAATGYLFVIGITVFLSQELRLFASIRDVLLERHLFTLLLEQFTFGGISWSSPDALQFLMTAFCYAVLPWLVIARRGLLLR